MELAKLMLGSYSLLQWLEFLLRIIAAGVCGTAIGTERNIRLKDAGIRTHCIIACAAALFMIISKYGFADMAQATDTMLGSRGADGARIAAQVVSGISFLGAGAIFKNGNIIMGLTTAAGIWITAAIGLAVGAGMYVVGVFATVLVLVIQFLFHRFSLGGLTAAIREVQFILEDDIQLCRSIQDRLKADGLTILAVSIERRPRNEVCMCIKLKGLREKEEDQLLHIYGSMLKIRAVEFS